MYPDRSHGGRVIVEAGSGQRKFHDAASQRRSISGPGRIRTYDQGIHVAPEFPPGVDYLFTLGRTAGRVRDARRLSSRALEALR